MSTSATLKKKIPFLIFLYGWGKPGEDLIHYQREENRCLDFEYAGDKNIVCKQTCQRDFSVSLFPHEYDIRYS